MARVLAYTVILKKDTHETDAKEIQQALSMVKGVLKVEPLLQSPTDPVLREQIKQELKEQLWNVLK